ncbi:aminodeoxychorismate/anthranilate synthase component II [Algivirga pacifica]|uniref:Aminodeoxychorismate/anthranilate synthase component II n=1 Tax=Algivirga pacifica TaxID=1162670 RepID=A0ABP9DK96_9BACT
MSKNILVIDNYDSFVYNLVHLIKELGYDPKVVRNDKITLEEVASYDKILLSPGPGIPSEAGIMPELLKTYGSSKSIMGVCLGHQAIGEAFGATLYNIPEVLHGIEGKVSILNQQTKLFKGLPETFSIGHYHSWIIDKESIDESVLEITALSKEGYVMAVAHREYDVQGVQFHPESVLTQFGKEMIQNWLGKV